MLIKLDEGAFTPTRAHETDAGIDIRSRETHVVPANGSAVFRTGVHVQLPPHTAGLLVSKSGLNVMAGITSTGLIDEGYTGEIVVKLYNHSMRPYTIEAGDKISQLVIIPVVRTSIDIVDDFGDGEKTERGTDGFGSSGR